MDADSNVYGESPDMKARIPNREIAEDENVL